ncbi:hypothetical protein [Acinetobacter sp. ANC 4640]
MAVWCHIQMQYYPRQFNLASEPFKPKLLHVDDDGHEHGPQHTRRESVYAEDLRRDDPPDQEETTELLCNLFLE